MLQPLQPPVPSRLAQHDSKSPIPEVGWTLLSDCWHYRHGGSETRKVAVMAAVQMSGCQCRYEGVYRLAHGGIHSLAHKHAGIP